MRKYLILIFLFLSLPTFAPPIKSGIRISEEDGAPSTYPYWIKVPNGSLIDNGGGIISLLFGSASNTLNFVTAPALPNSSGTEKQFSYDTTYLYVCITANTWKRIAWDATWIPANYFLLLETGDYLLQENGDKIIL